MTSIEVADKKRADMLKAMDRGITPLRAIRYKCLDCTCFDPIEVKNCPCEDCPLWAFRLGKNPNRKGRGGNLAKSGSKTEGKAD